MSCCNVQVEVDATKQPPGGFNQAENSIFVEAQWNAKPGVTLVPGLKLGKVLGAGMQVRVDLTTDTTLPTLLIRRSLEARYLCDR